MYRVGVDLGGSKIVAGVVDDYYRIVGRGCSEAKEDRTVQELVDDIVEAVNMSIKDAGTDADFILSIGIATPGTVDKRSGIIEYANNLSLDKVPLRQLLWQYFDKPIYFENDANCVALGESLAGVGERGESLMAIILDKGVGGGIIINGKILNGCNDAAGEIGHMVINVDGEPCSCGRRGCFESYASITALIRLTKQAMKENKDSEMWNIVSGDLDNVNGRTVFEGIAIGDKTAKQVFAKFAYYVSIGITNIVNIFQPTILCIGGRLGNEGETLLAPIRKMVDEQRYSVHSLWQTKICCAVLGNDASIIGSALLED